MTRALVVPSGKLRATVVIESRVNVRGAKGGVVPTWTSFRTRRCKIRALRGTEFFQGKQLAAEVDHEIEMRYVAGITQQHRARIGTRVFDIVHPNNVDNRSRKLLLLVRESPDAA